MYCAIEYTRLSPVAFCPDLPLTHSLKAAVLLVPSVTLARAHAAAVERVAAKPPGHAGDRATVILPVYAAIDRVVDTRNLRRIANARFSVLPGLASDGQR